MPRRRPSPLCLLLAIGLGACSPGRVDGAPDEDAGARLGRDAGAAAEGADAGPTEPGRTPWWDPPDGAVPEGLEDDGGIVETWEDPGPEDPPEDPPSDPSDPSDPSPGPTSCPFVPGAEPQKRAVFVDQYPEEDTDIEDELLRLIAAALPDSEIRIALFTFTRGRMARALVDAQARGVDVRVVLDERNYVEDPEGSGSWRLTRAVQTLVDGLGADRVVLCNASTPRDGGGCMGTGINHNKLFLFSALCDGSGSVVVQSSANLTNPQLRSHNNMLVIRDDSALYEGYRRYWRDLAAQRQNLDYYRVHSGDTGTQAYFFPRASSTDGRDPTSDPISVILRNRVECAGGTRVRIAMAFWTQARGYLVDDLRALQRDGCDVRVVVSAHAASPSLIEDLYDALPDWRVRTGPGIHSKYLLIDGGFNGRQRRLLWTGSHNYTGSALGRNDEAMLRVEDDAIWEAYRANWRRIWDGADPR